MKVLLLNVDARWNLAIRKLYTFHTNKGDEVEMRDLGLSGYPHKKRVTVDASGFDLVYCSNLFEINTYRVTITGTKNVIYGGVGSRNPGARLTPWMEDCDPYYAPGEKITYGFLTRGCIRNCWFCKVPKHEGKLRPYRTPAEIIRGVPGEVVKFLDNNILAYSGHMEILNDLAERQIRCEFNQGLDFRLANEENIAALARLNYNGEYIFAFDDPKYKPLLDRKIQLIKKHIPKPWKVKFYIYFHPDMHLSGLFDRIEWCRHHECLPYLMRDQACWDSPLRSFLIDLAAYCNQPSFFKNLSFEEFLEKRHEGGHISGDRMAADMELYLAHY